MGIFMFITFASANLITIGAMWYGLMSQYRYNNGMVLGVHIPPEHAEEPGVTEQVTNARRKMKRFHIINLILIMALSILCFLIWHFMLSSGLCGFCIHRSGDLLQCRNAPEIV